MKLPKETAKEKTYRDAAMEEGLKTAVSQSYMNNVEFLIKI